MKQIQTELVKQMHKLFVKANKNKNQEDQNATHGHMDNNMNLGGQS
jgi:hypothetical protein